MEKTNARGIGAEAQYELRIRIIKMYKDGKSGQEIARELGVSEGHVSNVKKAYREGGMEALKVKMRGRREKTKRILTPEQERELLYIVVTQKPEQYFDGEYFWSKKLLMELVQQKYDIDIKQSTMKNYLDRWHFNGMSPNWHASHQGREEAKRWFQKCIKDVLKYARAQNAVLLFANRKNIRIVAEEMYTVEELRADDSLFDECVTVTLMAAVTKKSSIFFVLYPNPAPETALTDFLTRLKKQMNPKIILIPDRMTEQHIRKVREWLQMQDQKIELLEQKPVL